MNKVTDSTSVNFDACPFSWNCLLSRQTTVITCPSQSSKDYKRHDDLRCEDGTGCAVYTTFPADHDKRTHGINPLTRNVEMPTLLGAASIYSHTPFHTLRRCPSTASSSRSSLCSFSGQYALLFHQVKEHSSRRFAPAPSWPYLCQPNH